MTRLYKRLKQVTGFSLIEVLIALFLTGIVTTAAFKTYITQHKNYIVQDDITEIQQSARASIDELTRQIRMAGFQLPYGLPSIIASNTNPDTITITYNSSGCNTFLDAAMPQPSSELKCGTDISCFASGQWVYIFEADSAKGEWFEITNVQTSSFHLQHNTMTLSRKYGAKSSVLSMVRVQFYIDKTDANHPNLMMRAVGKTPQVYAENISDLQFKYKLTNGTTVDVPAQVEDIREVLISLTGRSANPDMDRPSTDRYRTRTYSSSVSLRNLGV
jgi:prepilin-type N-terminal cleavage/methylation domain-containing protein